ncbi:MAG: hypothetical protein KBC72_00920 [Acinetobacter sp.]|nr:hypothetical protein [Acinetobacter sp.]
MIVLYFFILIAALGVWLGLRSHKLSKLKSILYTSFFILILSAGNWYLIKSNNEFLSTSEISSKNYNNILNRYNDLKGSVKGEAFRVSIVDAISDGLITPNEYKSIMGSEVEVHLATKEQEHVYSKYKQVILTSSVFKK